jgi:transcriptional regulator with XRE-family HTH domain
MPKPGPKNTRRSPIETTDTEELEALGSIMRGIREEHGLTVDAVATGAGITPARLVALEAGQLDPDYELLLRLAAAMDTRLATIFRRAEGLPRDDVSADD